MKIKSLHLALFLFLGAMPAGAQELPALLCPRGGRVPASIHVCATIEAWPRSTQFFHHKSDIAATGFYRRGIFRLSTYVTIGRWGDTRAKIPGSFVNAESGRVLERTHGIAAGVSIWSIEAGLHVSRRAVHWLQCTARDDCVNDWPRCAGTKEYARECLLDLMASDAARPAVGYHDGLRAYVMARRGAASLYVITPPWIWKDLTLPWPGWIVGGGASAGRIFSDARLEVGGLRAPALDARLAYRLAGRLYLGAALGALAYPGWERAPLRRVALVAYME